MPRPAFLVTILLLLAAAGAPAPAAAQVQRCTTPDGIDVYTDRACPDVGAVEQPKPAVAPTGAHERRGGCSRNLQDLLLEMTSAFDAHDANRLASVYHWAGMSGSTAYNVLARLDALVQRPLIDIVPVMPAERSDTGVLDESLASVSADPLPPSRQTPVALRVEQTQANGITPSRTVFGLQKHFGCWWIKG